MICLSCWYNLVIFDTTAWLGLVSARALVPVGHFCCVFFSLAFISSLHLIIANLVEPSFTFLKNDSIFCFAILLFFFGALKRLYEHIMKSSLIWRWFGHSFPNEHKNIFIRRLPFFSHRFSAFFSFVCIVHIIKHI